MSRQKRTIAIDFDGVLHRYSGYRDGFIDVPIEGARGFVERLLARGNTPVVFTTRDKEMVEQWLKKHKFPAIEVTNHKRPFWLILDDRAIEFAGQYNDALIGRIEAFKPYWIEHGPADGERESG
jgi:hypothetical protein